MRGTRGSRGGQNGSSPEMDRFVTLDLNGWLDHLVVDRDTRGAPDEGRNHRTDDWARTLGFRSPLFQQPPSDGPDHDREDAGTWLFGAQALVAARHARPDAPLIDAIDALALAAGHGNADPETRKALPLAVWQLVADCARSFDKQTDAAHLALVIPDGRYLGRPRVERSGLTTLESLHSAFIENRPRAQNRSRVELIWRSVAALWAAMSAAPEKVGHTAGTVLVINVNRRTFWTVLELRHWPEERGHGNGSLCIARRPVMDDCNEDEAWTTKRVEYVQAALGVESAAAVPALRRWTRGVEILATGMNRGSLAAFGVEMDALEHWSWPVPDGDWELLKQRPNIRWSQVRFGLPERLETRLRKFAERREGEPLAIVIESPTGAEAVSGFEGSVRKVVPSVPIVRVTGRKTAEAAASLAFALERDPTAPAWLDHVPAIDLEVRINAANGATGTTWKPVIAKGIDIPAGETYHTPPDDSRKVTLAPGVEYVHLHLRRGSGDSWDERYSGRETGHTIQPSDHERVVQPLARVRPLSGEARIEIVEHRPDGETQVLAGSRSSVRWSEMRSEAPAEMGSIPELYVFRASEEGWLELEPLLVEVVTAGVGHVSTALRDRLYKCTQRQWREQVFPLGSDGQPPRTLDGQGFVRRQRLLRDATGILLSDLRRTVDSRVALGVKAANRFHMPLTWLFTGCPEGAIRVLLDALLDRTGQAASTLLADKEYSLWSIYQGVGRTVRNDEDLKVVFDELIGAWEASGGSSQDKYLLSAVSHPLARRVSARRVLGESQERFDRVHRFLKQHLDNVVRGIGDPLPGGKPQQSLELRYVTMGYRGLCQIRYGQPDWFAIDDTQVRWAHEALIRARTVGKEFEKRLVDLTAAYLIGEGTDPTMPGGF